MKKTIQTISFADAMKKLTPREIEILEWVGQGLSNREIADRLHISLRTVQTHRSNICRKLKLNGRNALLKWYLKAVKADTG